MSSKNSNVDRACSCGRNGRQTGVEIVTFGGFIYLYDVYMLINELKSFDHQLDFKLIAAVFLIHNYTHKSN